jgi:hypothetical protein
VSIVEIREKDNDTGVKRSKLLRLVYVQRFWFRFDQAVNQAVIGDRVQTQLRQQSGDASGGISSRQDKNS